MKNPLNFQWVFLCMTTFQSFLHQIFLFASEIDKFDAIFN